MFKKRTTVLLWTGRELPLRNEQLSIDLNTLAIRGQIWFTPEVVISDALNFLSDLLWIWKVFRTAVPVFSLRVAAIVCLIVLITGLKDQPDLASAISRQAVQKGTPVTEVHTSLGALSLPIYVWPVPRTRISTYFSSYHQGIDIPEPYGLAVHPYTAGIVTLVGWDSGGFGNTILISHDRGYTTRYAHLSKISVVVGQKVDTSTIIGNIGATGFATGPHLHFEVYKGSKAINPLTILP